MALREELEATGLKLFRWRSYFPLFLLFLLIPAIASFRYPDGRHSLDLFWEAACFSISLLGLLVRAIAIGYVPSGTSRRGTRAPHAEALNTSGMYSALRHPLYLGNYLMWLGVTMFPRVWWCPVITSFAFFIYYERIMFAEEEFLRRKFGAQWLDWASRTPAIIPSIRSWKSTGLRFSLWNVLKREYSALFALVASFTFLEIVGDFFARGELTVDVVWGATFATSAVLWIVLRSLKGKTKLFGVTLR